MGILEVLEVYYLWNFNLKIGISLGRKVNARKGRRIWNQLVESFRLMYSMILKSFHSGDIPIFRLKIQRGDPYHIKVKKFFDLYIILKLISSLLLKYMNYWILTKIDQVMSFQSDHIETTENFLRNFTRHFFRIL